MAYLAYGAVEFDVTPDKWVSLRIPTPDGPNESKTIFCPWEELTAEQQGRFLMMHDTLADMTTLFDDVFTGPKPGEYW
ncbi:MAG: hypothetical protein CVU73_14975 [Deltaproteobacteria bacterium HGW-Deltaproteobacteria-8]|nr:MAG: hypothetical protein CVU73_14975 [Deltaproteobacteria bacterium HGW-Deltaproteobacteria-8]